MLVSLLMTVPFTVEGNFTVVQIQLRTVPPNIAAVIYGVCTLTLSAKIKKRYPIFFANAILFLIACSINLATLNPKARFVKRLWLSLLN